MTPTNTREIAKALLAFSAALDPYAPKPDPTVLLAWETILTQDQHLTWQDAKQAVTNHYARTTTTIMPADILTEAKRIRTRKEETKPRQLDTVQQIQHDVNQRGTRIVAQHLKWRNHYKKTHGQPPTPEQADQHIQQLRRAA